MCQAATKLRSFFLALLQPIRTSMTTNLQVAQSSIFLKYRPLFVFLQRHAPPVANEVQRAYVGTARTFYETGFRRYIRSLGWLKVTVSPSTKSGCLIHGCAGPDIRQGYYPCIGIRGPNSGVRNGYRKVIIRPHRGLWCYPCIPSG